MCDFLVPEHPKSPAQGTQYGKGKMRKLTLIFWGALMLALALSSNLQAQELIAHIRGTVTDPSGAGVQSYSDWRGRIYSLSMTVTF